MKNVSRHCQKENPPSQNAVNICSVQKSGCSYVGPLQPQADKGKRFILTLADYASRYPEAIALPGIDTKQNFNIRQVHVPAYFI